MPRSARIDLPGLLQHVMVRGIERREIFLDDEDYRRFLERFSTLLSETATVCYAWALLPNHVHLLLKPTEIPLARLMRRLLTGYAVTFNRRHQRVGHLFQNRYKSLVCEEEAYLLELIRYIHLNPLRAGLAADLDALRGYPWCGHGVLLGERACPGQEVSEVLQRFGLDQAKARQNYLRFVADGVDAGPHPELSGRRWLSAVPENRDGVQGESDGVLGGCGFQARVQGATGVERVERMALAELLQRVCTFYHVEADVVRQPGRLRRIAEVRAVICYVGVRLLGHPGQSVGRMLSLGSAGVTIAAARGERLWRENGVLRDQVINADLEN